MMVYLIKSTFLFLVFFLIYKWNLENKKALKFRRFYLLVSLVLALTLPLLKIQFTVTQNVIVETKQMVLEQMPEIVPFQEIAIETEKSLSIVLMVYLVISTIFLIRFGYNIYKIFKLKRTGKTINSKFGSIITHSKIKTPFTFLNCIYVNKQIWEKGEIDQAILFHEQAHVQQKHSLDVLFVEILKIFFWFQPFIYFYKRIVQENHEYLADDFSLQKTLNLNHYQTLILNYYSNEPIVALSSSIHFNNLKKRFIMMKNVEKGRVWETIFYSSAVLVTYFGFVGIEAKAAEINKIETKVSSLIEQPTKIPKNVEPTESIRKEVKEEMKNDPIILTYIKGEKSSGYFNHKGSVYFYVVDENLTVSIYNRYGVVQNETDFLYELKAVSKTEKEKLAIDELNKSSELENKKEIVNNSDEVFNFVNKKAEPKEGMLMFMKNFAQEFKAPENINSDEIKMRLKFIVETDGSFSNILTPQESFKPDESYLYLQEEAIRTLKTMPKWNPAENNGEVVRSTFTLPIRIRVNPVKTDLVN